MRKRSIVTRTSFMLTLAIISGCGAPDETVPPPADVSVTNAPPPVSELPLDTPTSVVAPGPEAPAAGTPPAQTPAAQTPPAAAPAGPDPALIAAGRQVFAGPGLCTACHGPNAQGTALGPNLTDGEWIWITESGEDIETQLGTLIRTGVTQPREYPAPMPPGGGGSLTDAQLESLVAYVLSLN